MNYDDDGIALIREAAWRAIETARVQGTVLRELDVIPRDMNDRRVRYAKRQAQRLARKHRHARRARRGW